MFSFKRKIDNQAEQLSLSYWTEHGLQLIEKNYLTRFGEIDLIMLDNEQSTLVFIEVRYRQNSNFGSPIDSVIHTKQSKLIRTAKQYLQQHRQYDDFICRFDVIDLESDLKYPKITWIKYAFEA